jgi:hypothetical protein
MRRTFAAIACALALGVAAPALGAAGPSTTKLLHGPIAFRLTGWQHADPTTSLGDYRYAIVFKLNRDPQGRLPDTDEEVGHGVTRGRFQLDGYEADVSHLHAPKTAPKGTVNCFVGYVDDENPTWLRKEGRKRLGRPVRVTLEPLTRRADGTNAYGPRMVRTPHLQQAAVALDSPDAKRRLAKIGC